MTFDQWWESTGAAMFEKNMGYTTAKAAWESARGDVDGDAIWNKAIEAAAAKCLEEPYEVGAYQARMIRTLRRDNSPRIDK